MANATVKLILRRDKRRPDGTAPVHVRATYARRTKERSTGIWVEEKKWNPARQQVRKSHPLAVVFNSRLTDKLNDARGRAASAQTVDDVFRVRSGSFTAFVSDFISKLEADGKHWEFLKYQTTAAKAHDALGYNFSDGAMPWDAITSEALERFVRHCRIKCGNGPNTVRKECIRLRTLCRKAVRIGELPPEMDPFLRFTMPRGAEVKRRRLSLSELNSLAGLDLELGTLERAARDIYLACVYADGARISDALTWKPSNVVEDGGFMRIEYRTQKSGRELAPKLPAMGVELLQPYLEKSGRYVFPLLKRGNDGDPVNLRKRQQAATARVNKTLKRLGEMAGIGGEGLTCHTARHSYASLARKSGTVYEVGAALGHKDVQTTQRYLDALHRDEVDALSDRVWGQDGK